MSGRMVSADEARGLIRDHEIYRERRSLSATRTDLESTAPDLAHTIVQQAEQIAADADRLRAGEASDGHHTHNELYDYRMLYNAAAAAGWLATGVPVVKSWRHSDGELCFGGGWFIVVATLSSGQVSNHYQSENWSLFTVPEVDLPPEYDGHAPQQAAERLRSSLGVTA